MGFHLFSKRVYDEDLCFIRDLIEMGGAVASVTSIQVMQSIMKGIIEKYGLEAKLQEFSDNEHYIVQDSYPSDRQKRISRASELLSISKKLPLSQNESTQIIYRALTCVKKMEFSYDEKIYLIKNNLVNLTGIKEIDDFMIQEYLELI